MWQLPTITFKHSENHFQLRFDTIQLSNENARFPLRNHSVRVCVCKYIYVQLGFHLCLLCEHHCIVYILYAIFSFKTLSLFECF